MTFSLEQLNFFKLSAIVMDEFPVALRQVFAFMWDTLVASPPGIPKWNDSVTVLNMLHAREGGVKKVPSLDKSYKEWDCTALFKATLFAQTFSKPDSTGKLRILKELYVKSLPSGTFHISVISPTGNQAETYALALDQLRLLRNTLCHQISTQKIDKTTFDHCIDLAKDAFTALGQDTTKIDDIGKLAEKDFPTERQQQLEEELKNEKDAATKLKQIDEHLSNIGSDVKDIKADVADIKQAMQAQKSISASAQYAEPAPMELALNSAAPAGASDEIKRKRSPSPNSTHNPKRPKVKKVKDGSPTDDELDDLSQELAENWKPLGRKLKIAEAKLTKFDKENDELEEKALQMLLFWKSKDHGLSATYQILNDGLKRVYRTDLAKKYCQFETSA